MRPVLIPVLVVLGACATQDVAAGSGKARFTEYPETLFAAIESACTDPAQSFSRSTATQAPDMVECREYLPPEPTAAIILKYDGTPRDLPQLVIRFSTQPDGPGSTQYLVENDVFLNVPQKTGRPLQVRQIDPRMRRTLDALYLRAGGVPE